jgi:hypothetical protein
LKQKNDEIDELKRKLAESNRQLEESIKLISNKKLEEDKHLKEELKKSKKIINFITSGKTELIEEDEVLIFH